MNSKPMSNEQIERRAKYIAAINVNNYYIEHHGHILPNKPSIIEWHQTVKDTTIRPTDIWISGYMKSGNTWLSEIVSLIMADGVVDRVSNRSISERVPNIMLAVHVDCNYSWFEGLTDPRITVNHLSTKYLPRFEGKEGKMIYIMRNPKDVCVSLYHFHHMMIASIDWHDFCQLFLNGDTIGGDWLSHVTDFWLAYGTGNHPNVLFVAYEELIADSAAMIATIGRFLGKHMTGETVANIATHCSLSEMRDNPAANMSDVMTRYGKPGAQFVRKGTIGDWRRHMTDAESALFDERYGQRLQALGLPVCDDLAAAERCMRAATGRIINHV